MQSLFKLLRPAMKTWKDNAMSKWADSVTGRANVEECEQKSWEGEQKVGNGEQNMGESAQRWGSKYSFYKTI